MSKKLFYCGVFAAVSVVLTVAFVRLAPRPARVEVQLVLTLHDGAQGTGWGVNLGSGRIVVPRHLLASCSAAKVVLPGQQEVPVEGVIWESDVDDVALLSLSQSIGPGGMLSDKAVSSGDYVWLRRDLREEEASGYRVMVAGQGFGNETVYALSGCHLRPGDSGSAVVDRDGRILGIVYSSVSTGALVVDVRGLSARVGGIARSEALVALDERSVDLDIFDDIALATTSSSDRERATALARTPALQSNGNAMLLACLIWAGARDCDEVADLTDRMLEGWPHSPVARYFVCQSRYFTCDWTGIAAAVRDGAQGNEFALFRSMGAFADGDFELCVEEGYVAREFGMYRAQALLWSGAALTKLGRDAEAEQFLIDAAIAASNTGDQWCGNVADLWIAGSREFPTCCESAAVPGGHR